MTKCNAILFSPASFCECFTNGRIDITKYLAYRRKSDMLDEDINVIQKIINSSLKSKKRKLDDVKEKKHCSLRTVKRHCLYVRKDDGTLQELLPTDTLWFKLYIDNPPSKRRMLKLF